MIISYFFLLTKLSYSCKKLWFHIFWAQCAENDHAWVLQCLKGQNCIGRGCEQALGLPKLAELCCYKQGACKIPSGITMTFSIFLIRKHILKGNNIEIEIFKVKPCFHKSQWDIWHRLLKNKDYTPNSLFMRNKWYFNVPVFFQTVSGKLLITEKIWKTQNVEKCLIAIATPVLPLNIITPERCRAAMIRWLLLKFPDC